MTVYVDHARIPYGRMKMCHMVADTQEELHSAAEAIGIHRRWYQGKSSFPHYDIALSKRKQAVANGAVEITRRELAAFMKAHRETEDYKQFLKEKQDDQ